MLAPYDDQGNRIDDAHRQTTLTRLVRRTRLDELPQLYNIISGDMSLIGPRPLLPKDQPKGTSARLAIAPGITGWAQVNGGDLLTPDEKLALDLWYVNQASVWLDLKIIYLTVLTVLYGDRRDDDVVRQATAELLCATLNYSWAWLAMIPAALKGDRQAGALGQARHQRPDLDLPFQLDRL